MLRSKIAGTGFYVPPHIVTNKDLEESLNTSDEWIQQRSGIKERRWVQPGEDTSLSMATKAAKAALETSGISNIDEIDAIIFGCLVTDYIFPGTGVLLQESLGFTRTIPALDIRNQCSGFIYAMSIADAWIKTGMYKKVLIVGSELQSTSLDKSPEGRAISVLFGDGAGAMVMAACDESEPHIMDNILHSEGRYADKLGILKPSTNDPVRIRPDVAPGNEIWPVMDGRLVFKNAVTRMTEVMQEILAKNNLRAEDLDFVIAHQANMRINQMVLDQLKIPFEKTHHTLDRYGNTTMATIPITFHEAVELGKIKRGDLVAFVAFGSGFTWAASLLHY